MNVSKWPNGWLDDQVFGITLYDYLESALYFCVTLLALLWGFRLAKSALKRLNYRHTEHLRHVADAVVGGIKPTFFWFVALFVGLRRLTLSERVAHYLAMVIMAVVALQVILIGQRLIRVGISRIHFGADPHSVKARSMQRNLSAIGNFFLWVAGVLFLLDNFGFNISTLVAGLGVGGIAIALATQAVLGDTFSSLVISVDKPFEIGDFIIVDSFMGTIEHIGLKTTRIRSLSGEQLIFPNSDLTRSRIRNFKKMIERRVNFRFGVTFDTTRENLAAIPDIIREAITRQGQTRFDRAHFFEIGASSLNFDIVYYVLSPDYNPYMDIQQAINLRLIDEFAARGIEFAFPTQTVMLGGEPEVRLATEVRAPGDGKDADSQRPPFGRSWE